MNKWVRKGKSLIWLIRLSWWLRLKHLPAMWEIWVQSLGREDPLEKEMATHSSILGWEISWTKESGGLRFMEVAKELNMT